jgi:hypothetical protein
LHKNPDAIRPLLNNCFLLLPDFSINAAQMNHILMLTLFFVFNILISTADIFTDFATAFEFFANDHFWWGFFTLLPIFTNLFIRICVDLFNLMKFYWRKDVPRFEVQLQGLPNLWWHFPFFHPIK